MKRPAILVCALMTSLVPAMAWSEEFVEHTFDPGISIEIPASWDIADQTLREFAARSGDSALDLSDGRTKANQVLIIAQKFDQHGKVAASIRLSVRPQGPDDIRQSEYASASGIELFALSIMLQSVSRDTVEMMVDRFNYIKAGRALPAHYAKKETMTCWRSEFEYDYLEGLSDKRSVTWMCPTETHNVKLTTSTNLEDLDAHTSVFNYVWDSLSIGAPHHSP